MLEECKHCFEYLIPLYQLIPYDWAIVTVYYNTYVNHLASRAQSIKHVEHVKPSYTALFDVLPFDIEIQETVFLEGGGVVGGLRYLKRCLKALPASLFPLFSACSLFHCSLDRFSWSTESLTKASCKQIAL